MMNLPASLKNSKAAQRLLASKNTAQNSAKKARAELAYQTSIGGVMMDGGTIAASAGVAGLVDAKWKPMELGTMVIPSSGVAGLLLLGVAIASRSRIAANAAYGMIAPHAYQAGYSRAIEAAAE